jgi:hypothetical protein
MLMERFNSSPRVGPHMLSKMFSAASAQMPDASRSASSGGTQRPSFSLGPPNDGLMATVTTAFALSLTFEMLCSSSRS